MTNQKFQNAVKALTSGVSSPKAIERHFATVSTFEAQTAQKIKELRVKYIPVLRKIYGLSKESYREKSITMETFSCHILHVSATQYKALTKFTQIIITNPSEAGELLLMPIQEVNKLFEPSRNDEGKRLKDGEGNTVYKRKDEEDEPSMSDRLHELESLLKKAKDRVRTIEAQIAALKAESPAEKAAIC